MAIVENLSPHVCMYSGQLPKRRKGTAVQTGGRLLRTRQGFRRGQCNGNRTSPKAKPHGTVRQHAKNKLQSSNNVEIGGFAWRSSGPPKPVPDRVWTTDLLVPHPTNELINFH